MIKTKALIHYFSGTGNSAHIAALVANELLKANVTPYLRSITEGILPYRSIYNLHVFIFPTYAYTLPAIVRKYLAALPPGRGSRVMLIATHGAPGYEGNALIAAAKIISRHGYQVQFTGTVACPESFTQFINPPHTAEQKLIYIEEIDNVGILVKKFMDNEQFSKTYSRYHLFWTGAVGLLFRIIGRRLLGKLYVADEYCDRCGICIRACPAGAVRLRKKPRWNYRCQACQRCINLCPQVAIQTSYVRPLLLLSTVVLTSFLVKFIFKTGYLIAITPWLIPLLGVGLWIVTEVILFYLVDLILFLLELSPGIGKLFGLSYTKSYRRYLEPHFKPVSRN
jgi:Ferredoxin